MDGKLCDQFVSILIDPGSNYNYVSSDLVDKCVLNKEVQVEFWLVVWVQVQEESVSLGKSLCIRVEWYAYIITFECIIIGII